MAAALLVAFSQPALADATVSTEDIPGAADNALAKRYAGSFVVSYDRSAYTDLRVPLSPLLRTADGEDRDRMNNRLYRPERSVEVEGALTRLVYVLPENRSPPEVLRNYQDVVAEAGGETAFECRREECGGDDLKAANGGGGEMSLTQYFFYDPDIRDEAFSSGACAVTSGISDQRFIAAKVPQDGLTAWVTVRTIRWATISTARR